MIDRLVNGLLILKIFGRTPCFHTRSVATEVRKSLVFPAFVKTHFNEIRSKNPEMKPTDIMKRLGEMYRATPPAELAKLTLPTLTSTPKTGHDKLEDRRYLSFAKKHGLPKPLPKTGYHVYIHQHLSGNKGTGLPAMNSKLVAASRSWNDLSQDSKEAYIIQASENKLAYLRSLKTWSEDNGIQFSKRLSVLARRFFAKHHQKSSTGKSVSSKAANK